MVEALTPPELLRFDQWTIEHFRLHEGSAVQGRFRPWKFQRGILEAFGDPTLGRVDVIKSARTGFTTSLMATIGAYAVNDPCPMILLVPTDDDARGIVVDEVDPSFEASPKMREIIIPGRFDSKNTLLSRKFKGGSSLKVLSAQAPRKLRRHTARVLVCDEIDGMVLTKEGDALKLAEKRTLTFSDRKIICGSTPVDDQHSVIIKRYEESDQRIFEVPCPECEFRFELMWEHMHWEPGRPETAVVVCPSGNGCVIEEIHKPQMVEKGEWRATKPEVKGHAGFRMSQMISLFANARWSEIVKEYEAAKKAGPQDMQVFWNTVLGRVWSNAITQVDENVLMARMENMGIEWDRQRDQWRFDIPEEIAYLTAGVDVQANRIEVVVMGHSPDHRYFLAHQIFFGSPLLETTWLEVDAFLATTWTHPLGGEIGISSACVDSGDGNMTETVYEFCEPRTGRKIVPIKGMAGPRGVLEGSKTKIRNYSMPLYIVGVDQVKTDILVTLPLEPTEKRAFRYGNVFKNDFFIQLTAERRELIYRKSKEGGSRPVTTFVRIGNRKAEVLDASVYAIAALWLVAIDYPKRYTALMSTKPLPRNEGLKKALNRLHQGGRK